MNLNSMYLYIVYIGYEECHCHSNRITLPKFVGRNAEGDQQYSVQGEDGVTQWEDGVTQGEDGVTQWEDGVTQGEDGVTQWEDGVTQGEDGVTQWEDGVTQGEDGVTQWEDGVTQGEDGVTQGEDFGIQQFSDVLNTTIKAALSHTQCPRVKPSLVCSVYITLRCIYLYG